MYKHLYSCLVRSKGVPDISKRAVIVQRYLNGKYYSSSPKDETQLKHPQPNVKRRSRNEQVFKNRDLLDSFVNSARHNYNELIKKNSGQYPVTSMLLKNPMMKQQMLRKLSQTQVATRKVRKQPIKNKRYVLKPSRSLHVKSSASPNSAKDRKCFSFDELMIKKRPTYPTKNLRVLVPMETISCLKSKKKVPEDEFLIPHNYKPIKKVVINDLISKLRQLSADTSSKQLNNIRVYSNKLDKMEHKLTEWKKSMEFDLAQQKHKQINRDEFSISTNSLRQSHLKKLTVRKLGTSNMISDPTKAARLEKHLLNKVCYHDKYDTVSINSSVVSVKSKDLFEKVKQASSRKHSEKVPEKVTCTPEPSCCDVAELRADKPSNKDSSLEKKIENHDEKTGERDHNNVQSEDVQTEPQSKYYIVNKNKPFSYLEPDPEFELYSKKKQRKKNMHCCMLNELEPDNSSTRNNSSWAPMLNETPSKTVLNTCADVKPASADSDIDLMQNCLNVGVLRSSTSGSKKNMTSVQNMSSRASNSPIHTIKIELMKNHEGETAKLEEFVCIAKHVEEEKCSLFPLDTLPANQIPIIRDIPKPDPKDKKKDKTIKKDQVRLPPHKDNPALKLGKGLNREELIQAIKYIELEIKSTNSILKELADKIIASEPTTVTKPAVPEPEPICSCQTYNEIASSETKKQFAGVLFEKQAMLTAPEEPVIHHHVCANHHHTVPEITPHGLTEPETYTHLANTCGATEIKESNLLYKTILQDNPNNEPEPAPECTCGQCHLVSKEPVIYFQEKPNANPNNEPEPAPECTCGQCHLVSKEPVIYCQEKPNIQSHHHPSPPDICRMSQIQSHHQPSTHDICRMSQIIKVVTPPDCKTHSGLFGYTHKNPEMDVDHIASANLKSLDEALRQDLDEALRQDLEAEKIYVYDKEVDQLGALDKTRHYLRKDCSSTAGQLEKPSSSFKNVESPITFPSFTLDQMDSLYLEKIIDADRKHEDIFHFDNQSTKTENKNIDAETRSAQIQTVLLNDGSSIKNAVTAFKPDDLLGNSKLSPESPAVKLSSNFEASYMKKDKPVSTPLISSPIMQSYALNNNQVLPDTVNVPINVAPNLTPTAEKTLVPTKPKQQKPRETLTSFNVVLENSAMPKATPIPLIKVNIFDESIKNYLSNIVKIEASMDFTQSLSKLDSETDNSTLKTLNNMTIPWNLLRCYQSLPNVHVKLYDENTMNLESQKSLTTIQIKKSNSDGVLMELHVLDTVLQRYMQEIQSVKAKILVKDKKNKNSSDVSDSTNPFKFSMSKSMHTCVTATKAAQSKSDELLKNPFFKENMGKKCHGNNVQSNRTLYSSRRFEKKKKDEDVPITLRQVLRQIEQNLGAAATDVFRQKRKEKAQHLLKDPLVNFGSLSSMSPEVIDSMEELRQNNINDNEVVETIQKDAKKFLSEKLKNKLPRKKTNSNKAEQAKTNDNYDKIEIQTVIKENINGMVEENIDTVVMSNQVGGTSEKFENGGDILDKNRKTLQSNRQNLTRTDKSPQSDVDVTLLDEPDDVDKRIKSIFCKAVSNGCKHFSKEKNAKKSSLRVNNRTQTRSFSNFEVEHRIPVNVAKYFENRMLELCRQRDEILDSLDNKPKKKANGGIVNVKNYSKATIVNVSEKDEELGPIENFVKINKRGKISYVGKKLKLPFLKDDDLVEVPTLVAKKKPLPKKFCNKIYCIPSQNVKDIATSNPFPVCYREKVKHSENNAEKNQKEVISVRLKRVTGKDGSSPDYPESSNDTLMDFEMTPETNPQTLNLLKRLDVKFQDTITENTKVHSQKLINMEMGTILEKLEQYNRIKKNKKEVKNASKKQ